MHQRNDRERRAIYESIKNSRKISTDDATMRQRNHQLRPGLGKPNNKSLRYLGLVIMLALSVLYSIITILDIFSVSDDVHVAPVEDFRQVKSPVVHLLSTALPPVLSETRAALARNKYGNYAVIQLLDKGYVDMTKHWICNVRKFDGVLDATVFLAMDEEAEAALKEFDSDLHVLLLPFKAAINEELRYGQVAYYELMELRTNLLLALLESDVSFMLVESDAYWARNALQEIQDLGWKEDSYDMISASDTMDSNTLQGGFQLNRASRNSKVVWAKLAVGMADKMTKLRNKYGHGSTEFVQNAGSEQIMMNTLTSRGMRGGAFRLRFFSHDLVASGQWYGASKWKKKYPTPCVILNNWIEGNDKKIERAMSQGHFSYDVENRKCMMEDAFSLLYSSSEVGDQSNVAESEGESEKSTNDDDEKKDADAREIEENEVNEVNEVNEEDEKNSGDVAEDSNESSDSVVMIDSSMEDSLNKALPPVLQATRAALARNKYGHYAVIQLLDKGYVDITKHWICNVRKFDGVLDATVFLAMDEEAEAALKDFDSDLNVVLLPFKSAINADLEYGQVAYYEMMEMRTKLLLSLLQNDVTFMLLESDVYWSRNALQEIKDLGWEENSFDMISASDMMDRNTLQGGFQLNRASANSKALWGKLANFMAVTMKELREKYGHGSTADVQNAGSEQVKMQELTTKGVRAGSFKLRYLPHGLVAGGQWYQDDKWKEQYPDPCAILNNWIGGNGNKIRRAILYGHFFYDIDAGKCMDPTENEVIGEPLVQEIDEMEEEPFQASGDNGSEDGIAKAYSSDGDEDEGTVMTDVEDDNDALEASKSGDREGDAVEQQKEQSEAAMTIDSAKDGVLNKELPNVLQATRAALARNKYGNYAVIQLLDKGYVDMTKHWICNMRKFDGVLDATVFLAMDQEAKAALMNFDSDLHVVLLPFKSAINADLEYGQVAYYELMELRTNLLLALLQNDVSFMLLESDTYWARNALQEIKGLGWNEDSYDMISASDTMDSNTLQGGFQLNRASTGSKSLWSTLSQSMNKTMTKLREKYGHGSTEFVAQEGSEQVKMNDLAKKGKRAGTFKLRFLPHELVAGGQWYQGDKWAELYPYPCVILNNWIVGNGNKIQRAVDKGHFFYDIDAGKCMDPTKSKSIESAQVHEKETDEHPSVFTRAMTSDSPMGGVLIKSLPNVLEAARAALARNKYGEYAVIQLLNKAYVDMTKHWICNVRKFDGVLDATVFLAMDEEAEAALKSFDSGLHVVLLPFKSAINADLEYGQVAYYEMMEVRTNLLLALLQNDVTFMLLESDVYWARNALQEIKDLGWEENSYDMISASDMMDRNTLQGGFQLNRASASSKALWGKLSQSMDNTMTKLREKYGHGSTEFVAQEGSEQMKMQELTTKGMLAGTFKLRFLPHGLVAGGQWYQGEKWAEQYPWPCVILNNWIMGNGNKIQRAIEKGHFFYDINTGKCMDSTKIKLVERADEAQMNKQSNAVAVVEPTINSPMASVLIKSLPTVLEAARAALARNMYGEYAVIQLLDKGFVDMTKHWICNVRKFDSVLDATVFLAMDEEAEAALKSFDSNLHVVLLPFKSAINADLEYGQVAYYEMMEVRTNLLLALLQNDVAFMLLESDAYWSRNALQAIKDLGWEENSYDMISASDVMSENRLQGGFQLNRASASSKALWGKLCEDMDVTMTPLRKKYGHGSTADVQNDGSEQMKMHELTSRAVKAGTFKLRYLPHELVASGQWYRDEIWQEKYPDPCVILNNWIVGNGNKIQRAVDKDHFLYDIDAGKCLEE